MATSTRGRFDARLLTRVGAFVGGCTVALTATFVGIVALSTGQATGAGTRVHFYVLAGGVTFVAAVVALEESGYGGVAVLRAASILAIAGTLLVGLAVEGLRYAVFNPDAVVGSSLVVYLVTASLIASGLGYWGLYNWGLVGHALRDGTL